VIEASARTVSEVLSVLCPLDWEIVIVDDGSLDRTGQVAERLTEDAGFRLIRHSRNCGKGAAVRTGVLATHGETVLLCDADLSTPPEMLPSFLHELSQGADIVVGDRRSTASSIERPQSLLRQILGTGYAALARQVAGVPLRDFNCGFKLFRGDAARNLFAQCRSVRWTWDVEVIALARRSGMIVRSLPVIWRQGDRSAVRPFRDAVKSFADLVSLWIRLRRA